MTKSLNRWQLVGFIFTGIAGTLLHFFYDWTNHSVIAAFFSAVNESIWEHMKLLFFPMFVFGLIENRVIGRNHDNFWCSKLVGAVVGLLLIPIFYYTYTGAFGLSADWFNIVIFFIAAGSAYYLETQILKQEINCYKSSLKALIFLCFIALLFIVLTFVQPKIPLFQDMSTGTYGIK